MPLTACQRRELDAIERTLQASDPHLTAMLAVFTRLTKGEDPTGIEPVPRLRRLVWPRIRTLALPVIAVLLVISGVILGATASGASTACRLRVGRTSEYVSNRSSGVSPAMSYTCGGPATRSVQCQQKISGTKLPSC